MDLRDPATRARIQGDNPPADREEDTAQDLHQLERITPPAPDLLEALEAEFAPYIPDRGHSARVAEEVAEQRGAWLVINFLKQVRDASLNKGR